MDEVWSWGADLVRHCQASPISMPTDPKVNFTINNKACRNPTRSSSHEKIRNCSSAPRRQ